MVSHTLEVAVATEDTLEDVQEEVQGVLVQEVDLRS